MVTSVEEAEEGGGEERSACTRRSDLRRAARLHTLHGTSHVTRHTTLQRGGAKMALVALPTELQLHIVRLLAADGDSTSLEAKLERLPMR